MRHVEGWSRILCASLIASQSDLLPMMMATRGFESVLIDASYWPWPSE